MKTFFNILQTLVGIKNKSYPDEEFKIPEKIELRDFERDKILISFIIGTIYYGIKKSKISNEYLKNAHYKLKAFNNIFENIFYTNEFKEHIAIYFIIAQKHYYAFTHLARIYKLKKRKSEAHCVNTFFSYFVITFKKVEPNN